LCKSSIALYCLYLSVIKRVCVTKALINPIIRTRASYFRYAYHPTHDCINVYVCIVQCSGYLISSDHQLYNVTPLKTPFGLLVPLLQSHTHVTTFTHNYFSLCATFTQLTIIHVRDYNNLLHSYTGCLDISVPLINPQSYERHFCLLLGPSRSC
jgi:hypothetical protein